MSPSPNPANSKCESVQARIEHAVGRLKSFREGDSGLLEVVDLGPEAVPALRRLLFDPEPSGLHQARAHQPVFKG